MVMSWLSYVSQNVDFFVSYIKRSYQGRNIWDDPIIEKSQDQDQGQGQGQDQKLRQRSALRQQMVLALTLTLVLTLVLAQITKVPLLKYFCSLLNDVLFLGAPPPLSPRTGI